MDQHLHDAIFEVEKDELDVHTISNRINLHPHDSEWRRGVLCHKNTKNCERIHSPGFITRLSKLLQLRPSQTIRYGYWINESDSLLVWGRDAGGKLDQPFTIGAVKYILSTRFERIKWRCSEIRQRHEDLRAGRVLNVSSELQERIRNAIPPNRHPAHDMIYQLISERKKLTLGALFYGGWCTKAFWCPAYFVTRVPSHGQNLLHTDHM